MALRLFAIYVLVELAVVVALISTLGFGWTLLLLAGTFLVGLALAGSQVKKHLRRLRTGFTGAEASGVATDSLLVALGTVLVVIPGLASTVAGALLLLPPTRALARPVATAMAARRAPLLVGGFTTYPAAGHYSSRHPGRGAYIDGEVIDVSDEHDAPVPPRGSLDRPRLPE
jgi:UPF0716 protein FxsA